MKRRNKLKIGVMDLILVILALFLLVYITVMVYVFVRVGAEPSALTYSVFGAATGELGIMGWIKSSKNKAAAKDHPETMPVEQRRPGEG